MLREPPPPQPPPPPEPTPWQRWRTPTVLYVLTCLSTLLAYGPIYAAAVMFILTAHEMGHYIQAKRWGVPASPPYFLPMPLTPLGTMGAVIAMRAHVAHRRALFDIAITGPLAGLVPALICSAIGIHLSQTVPTSSLAGGGIELGEPLIFQWMSALIRGPVPEGQTLLIHPLGFAGWVGIFITALNLLPIGQLDGGHLLYALLRRRAHTVAIVLMAAALAAMIIFKFWMWILMWALIFFFGVRHPPTADDYIPLGRTRIILGWLTLAFFIIGFTPVPLELTPPAAP